MDTSPATEPLTAAAFFILLALADAEAHGYAIMADTERLSGGRTRLGPGTLYRTLHRLVPDGLVSEVGGASANALEDERRRTYRITPAGRAAARREAERLELMVQAARERGLLASSGRTSSRTHRKEDR